MEKYQFSSFDERSPISCSVQTIDNITAHKHDFFELDMILSGTCTLVMDERRYSLEAEDVFAVNPHTLHELWSAGCILVTIQFNQTVFENSLPSPEHPNFDCNSRLHGNSEAYQALRRLIARIVKNSADRQPGYALRNRAMVYELMDVLYNNFRVESTAARNSKGYRHALRITQITDIISEKYAENISLTDLADMVHLSPPYLSKFFSQQFGLSFLAYLTQYRLEKATRDLLDTQKNIEEIAADNGFPNSHAFVQAFKNTYNELPSVYRRRMKGQLHRPDEAVPIIEHHDNLTGLKKYLEEPKNAAAAAQGISCYVRLKATDKGKPLLNTWKNILNVGNASDILLADIQNMIRTMQKEIGFHYIHFTGIFSDELRICQRGSGGDYVFNFVYLDVIFDFLLGEGLKPFIQLAYMPSLLAKHPYRRLLNSVVSEPENNKDWCALVSATVRHLIDRYSLDEVKTWMFSIWNQPDTPRYLFGFGDDEVFFRFYVRTFRTLKEIDPDLPIASSPTFYLFDMGEKNWYIEFTKRCIREGCRPDALSFTFYDTRLVRGVNKSVQTFDFVDTMHLSTDENSFAAFVRQILAERELLGLADLPIFLTEWNNTPSHQDLLNDTCFKSCYVAKNILENYDCLDSFGYWTLTDLMGEAPLPDKLFFGGLGIFTKNGIAKPVFYVFQMLNQLRGRCIGNGPGWFAVRDGDVYKILVYNYRHYTELYASGEQFIVTYDDRYNIFEPTQTLDIHIKIENAQPGDYIVKETSVGRKNGSVFDLWVEMGALEPLGADELEILKHKSRPMITKYLLSAKETVIELDAILDMLEVRLVSVFPAK